MNARTASRLALTATAGSLLLGAAGWLMPRADAQPPAVADARFAGLQWTFARVRYDAWTLPPGRRYDIFDEPWTIDYPAAEQNLSRRVKTVTSIQVNDPVVITLEDPALWTYPWIYIVEPGNLRLRDAEVANLREFLLRGGTLTFDDFHGPVEWANLEREMKRVFPDRKIVDLPRDHPIYHCFYQLEEYPQTPGLGSFLQGRTWEKGATSRRSRPSRTTAAARWCSSTSTPTWATAGSGRTPPIIRATSSSRRRRTGCRSTRSSIP